MNYRAKVFEHRERVGVKLSNIARALVARGRHHDNSMLDDMEKSVFEREMENWGYTIPNSSAATEIEERTVVAWSHHYEFNDHHPEHFKNGINDMNMLQLIEFLTDVMSYCEKHGIDTYTRLNDMKDVYGISDQLYQILVHTVEEIYYVNR